MGNGEKPVAICDSTPEEDWETIKLPIPLRLREKIVSFVSLLRVEEMIIEVIDEDDISFLSIEGSKGALDSFGSFASLLKNTDL